MPRLAGNRATETEGDETRPSIEVPARRCLSRCLIVCSQRELGREHLTERLSTGGRVTRSSRNPHRLYPLIPRHQRRGLVVGHRSSCCDGQGDSRHMHVVGRLAEQYYVVLSEGQEAFVDGDPELLVGWLTSSRRLWGCSSRLSIASLV